jgi:uncharacterized protein involved in exopolysaccharide biosynthesis
MRENYSKHPAHPQSLPRGEEANSTGIAHADAQTHPSDDLPVPEAELLRIIERALQSQRVPQPELLQIVDASTPLVSRIETILGKRLQAANDTLQAPDEAVSAEIAVPAEIDAPETPAYPFALDDDILDRMIDDHLNADPVRAAVIAAPAPHSPLHGRSLLAIGALCVVGAAAGMFMPAEPSGFRADAVLSVHGAREDRPALVTSARNTLLSPRTIAAAVTALKLDRDHEFAGGNADAFNVVVDLLSATGAAADPVSKAEASLAAAVQATTDAKAGTVGFHVVTGSAAKSARIASYLVSAMARPAPAAAADQALVKKASTDAEAQLAAFIQQNGEGNVQVATRLQQQIADADAAVRDAEQRTVTAKTQADLLKTGKADDVLTGALSTQISSPTLEDRRGKYAVAKSTLAQLAANLGPRHPRLIAQQAEVDGLRDAITEEIGRLSRDAGEELKASVASRRQISDQRNALIAQSKDTGVDLAKLTELREKVAVARQRLDDELSTGAIPDDAGRLVVLQAPQVVAVSPGRSPWFTPVIGALAGLAFGLAGLWRRRSDTTDNGEPAEAIAPMELVVDMPPELSVDPDAEEAADEMHMLRAEIAMMREKLRSYGATA